jgi:hypothetical protein
MNGEEDVNRRHQNHHLRPPSLSCLIRPVSDIGQVLSDSDAYLSWLVHITFVFTKWRSNTSKISKQ